jgi:hypothetical protein
VFDGKRLEIKKLVYEKRKAKTASTPSNDSAYDQLVQELIIVRKIIIITDAKIDFYLNSIRILL